MDFQVGSWVTSFSLGVWRVYRVLTNFIDIAPGPSPTRRTLVFSARFLTAKGKPRISFEVCDARFVAPLGPDEFAGLATYIEQNPKAIAAFESAAVKSPDLVYNLALGASPEETALLLGELEPALGTGLTLPQIQQLVRESTVGSSLGANPMRSTLHLVSPEHEVRDRQFVFRQARVLAF